MRPFDDVSRLERAQALDRIAAPVRTGVQRLLRNRAVKDALHGVWLGHPLHPALAQFALGSFLSATLLDLLPGTRRQSSVLIATGLAATLPTVAAGWTDWSDSHEEQQRVGLVHAATNGTAAALYASALITRMRGRRGRWRSLAGGALAGVGAMLGGHLGYRQSLGPNHAESVTHVGSSEWQELGAVTTLPEGNRFAEWRAPSRWSSSAVARRCTCSPTAARTWRARSPTARCAMTAWSAPGTAASSGSRTAA